MTKLSNIYKLSTKSLLAIAILGGLVAESKAAPVIEAPATPVPTRTLVNPSIDLSLGSTDFSDYTLETLASGSNTEVINGITANKLSNGNIELSVPPNIYDPNNPDYYISIPINFNQVSSPVDQLATFEVINVTGGGGQGAQDLLIPPADSGFETKLETIILASFSPD